MRDAQSELVPGAKDFDTALPLSKWRTTTISIRPSEPALSKTCHQIRSETLAIFYGENIFRASPFFPDCRKFLLGLQPAKRMMLRHVYIGSHPSCPHPPSIHPPSALPGYEPCMHRGKQWLSDMAKWLKDNDIELTDGVVWVRARVAGADYSEWTNDPKGECGCGSCSDNDSPG